MNTIRRTPLALALLLALACTACSEQPKVDEAATEGGALSRAFAEAREELRTENLSLSGGEGVPKAELTPQGDLLIDGVAVPMTAEQREAVLAFRTETLAVADAGMKMGEKGVDIAGDALALAAKGVFGGDTTSHEAAIEAKGKAMEADALALCRRVEGLDAAQERLAALLPAFAPYAEAMKMDANCDDKEDTTAAPAAATTEV